MLLIIIVIFLGCKEKLKPLQYAQFVQGKESGLMKVITVDNWDFVFQYKPYDYILLMEQRTKDPDFNFKKRMENLKGTAWFNISVRRSDGNISPMRYNLGSNEEYNQRLNYFLNEAVKNIRLIYDKKDTLMPMAYEFENNYNLSPQETMLVGFKLPKDEYYPKKAMQLTYDDQIFGNGTIKAMFSTDNLKKIPALID